MDSQCPTCGQFLQLQSFITELQQNLSQLNQKVNIKEIEQLSDMNISKQTCAEQTNCFFKISINLESETCGLSNQNC